MARCTSFITLPISSVFAWSLRSYSSIMAKSPDGLGTYAVGIVSGLFKIPALSFTRVTADLNSSFSLSNCSLSRRRRSTSATVCSLRIVTAEARRLVSGLADDWKCSV